MLKGFWKKGIALGCALMLSMSVVGCDAMNANVDPDYDIWTTYATTKVLRDVEFNSRYLRSVEFVLR